MDGELLLNPIPDVELLGFIKKYPIGVTNTGTSYLAHDFREYIKCPGPMIMKIQCVASSADTDASAGFDYKLIDN